jgi:putative peptide zinc metalloprotease protein
MIGKVKRKHGIQEAGAGGELDRVVRLRPDIEWTKYGDHKRSSWIARDPISLEYFHFQQSERALALALDGKATLKEILAKKVDDVSAERISRLVQKLDSACLTVPQIAGENGQRLWGVLKSQRRRSLFQLMLSPLAIRIKIFDPTRLLQLLAPLAKLLFSTYFVVFCAIMSAGVGVAVITKLIESPFSLASSFENITAQRAASLVLIYVLVKSLHELGHALACKKWTAECHEIGVFILVFTPCLYCNTTDSWKLSSRWRRACVAAAGIYVELIAATLGGVVWLTTATDSVLHLLGANVMIISSLSTVLVNANPLLRYDGYYVLSDLWGVPNLADQAREALRAFCTAWLTGKRMPQHRWDSSPAVLAAYGLTAWLYRHFVAIMVVWAVWLLSAEFGLKLAGFFFAVITLANLALAGLFGFKQWVREIAMAGGVRLIRLLLLGVIAVLGFYGCLYKSWPTTISSRVVTTFDETKPIYAEHAGILVSFAAAGQDFDVGTELVRIESPELDLQLIDARGKVAMLVEHISQLKSRLVDEKNSATELANTTEELAKAREQLKILESEADSLAIIADSSGVLLANEFVSTQTLTELSDLENSRPLLSLPNLGRRVERGALLGWTSRLGKFELTAYVSERDAELLSPGMEVYCRWDCEPAVRYVGVVSRVAPEPITEIPASLQGDESIPFRISKNGIPQPERPHYEVNLNMVEFPKCLSHQSLATAHVQTAPRTIYQSLQRLFDTLARPDL